MPVLLDEVTDDTVGDLVRVPGPWSIFASGDFDGGTVTIGVARTAEEDPIVVATLTEPGAVNDTIIGPHYVQATLAGTGAAADVTVSHSRTNA